MSPELKIFFVILGIIVVVVVVVSIYKLTNNDPGKSPQSSPLENPAFPPPSPTVPDQPIARPAGPVWQAFVWPTVVNQNSMDIAFPELCQNEFLPAPVNTEQVSIAYSGGGTRAYAAAIGQTRALNQMGYKNKAQFVSTSSGGAWLYGAYSHAQPSIDADTLTGVSCGPPETITLQKIASANKSNKFYLGHGATDTKILLYAAEALLDNRVSLDQLWNYAIGKMFLQPYGLDTPRPIALNKKHAESLSSRNKFELAPLYAMDGMPFWLCGVSLSFEYANQFPNTYISFNPLYSGIAHYVGDEKYGNTMGGHAVESFAFGNTLPPLTPLPPLSAQCNRLLETLSISDKRNTVRTLRDMIGISSMSVFAAISLHPEYLNKYLPYFLPKSLVGTVPLYNMWGKFSKSVPTSADSQCSNSLFGCTVPEGYNPGSCTKYLGQCYSSTAPQCAIGDCQFNPFTLTCENKTGASNLNCRLRGLSCSCITPPPQKFLANNFLASNVERKFHFSAKDFESALPLSYRPAHVIDTGFVDNSAIIPLLQRNVKKIIAFANLMTLLVDSDGVVIPKDTDGIISGLFGSVETGDSTHFNDYSLNSVQVFAKTDWSLPAGSIPVGAELPVKNQFANSYRSGGPTYAHRKKLRVLPNKNFGVKGNYDVEILILFLQPSSTFVSMLPSEVRNEINPKGKLANFPCFSTSMQNSDLGLLTLTLEQVNLLSTYAEWSLNTPHIKAIVNHMFV